MSLGTKSLNEEEQHSARGDWKSPKQENSVGKSRFFNATKIAVELMLPVGYEVLKIAVKGL